MLYRVILADSPWKYKRWNDAKSQRPDHYPRMTIEQLCALDVGAVAAPNCVLFFWVVDWLEPKHAQAVIEAWGFTYRTKAWTWIKSLKDGTGFHMGMGKYTRANPEDCWLCVRGDMPVAAHNVTKVIYAPITKHSAKPVEQYAKIDKLYPRVRALELFARSRHSSRWHVWGNQLPNDVQIQARAQ